MSDNELLTILVTNAQKDEKAFGELYQHFINKVYYWCFNMVSHSETAKDLAQETMISIFKSLHSLDKPENFVVWAYVVTKNTCNMYFRKKYNSDVAVLNDDEIIENIKSDRIEYDPKKKLDEKSRNEIIINLVDDLPKRQKEIISLFYLDEMSIKEISIATDSKEATVKSILFKGRKSLEKSVQKYEKTNGIRLYDMSIFMILGSVLSSYSKIICERQDFGVFADILPKDVVATQAVQGASGVSKLVAALSAPVKVLLVVGLTTSVLAGAGLVYKNINKDKTTNRVEIVEVSDHSNIKDITTQISDDGLEERVTVHLHKEEDRKDISIMSDKEVLPFEMVDSKISFQVSENGLYTINVKESASTIRIESLKRELPVVRGYTKKNGVITFDIDDQGCGIDYEKSYIISGNVKYPFNDNCEVIADVSGEVSVFIYTDSNRFVSHKLAID